MRALDLLLEYSQKKTLKQWAVKLVNRLMEEAQSNNFAKQVWEKVAPEQEIEDEDAYGTMVAQNILEWFEKHDPSKDNKYTEWMVRLYVKGGIEHLEDIEARIREQLVYHNRLARSNRIDNKYKNIDNFKNIHQLEEFIDEFYGEDEEDLSSLDDTGKQLINADQAELVHNGPKYFIVKPKTYEASCYFGSGTKWCTTWRASDVHWKSYSRKGDFFYVFDKNEHKKLAINFGAREYRNPRDQMIPYETLFTKYADMLKILIKNAGAEKVAEQDPIMGFFINPNLDENQAIAVKREPKLLKQIENPSEELKEIAIKSDPEMILNIENPSQKLRKAALDKAPELIAFFDDATLAERKTALKRKPQLISKMKEPEPELVDVAVAGWPAALEDDDLRKKASDKAKVKAISKDPSIIKVIENPTDEMKETAITKEPKLLPSLYDDPPESAVIAAMTKEPVYIYKRYKDKFPNLLNSALETNGSVIKYIKNPTPEQQMKAVKSNPNAYVFISNPADEVKEYVKTKRPKLVK